MTALSVAPVQWSTLKNIDDVKPLNDDDTDCLIEIRHVLKKHGMLDRFGIALLHSHFDLANDEIMLESTEEDDSRTLITKAVKQSEAGGINVGTIWMLREGEVTTMSWCRKYCRTGNVWISHRKAHNKEK